MVEISKVDDEALRGLARWTLSRTWPIEPGQFAEMADGLGWELDSETARSSEWTTGLMEFRPWASVILVQGSISSIVVSTASVRSPAAKDAASGRAMRDIYADQVGVVEQVLGRPSERDPGTPGSVRWKLRDGSIATLSFTKGLCDFTVTSPTMARAMERADW